jgi:hypothetical protein
MTFKDDRKSNKSTLISKKTIFLTLQLSFTMLILFGAVLAPIGSSAQSIPSISTGSPSSGPSTSPPFGPSSTGFPPPPMSPELSAAQKSASTNKTCTLTPSLIESEGTPQQIEGPYFVGLDTC